MNLNTNREVRTEKRGTARGCVVLDIAFVCVTLLFFAVSIGYVAWCDRLMK